MDVSDIDLESNKKTVIRAMGLLTGETDLADLEELIAPGYVDHNSPESGCPTGPARVAQVSRQLQTAFPDLTYDVEDIVAEGDRVALRLLLRGTHDGPLMGLGLPGTGKRVAMKQIHLVRLEDGKIVDHWAVRDDLGMLRQLGLLGGPGGADDEDDED